MSIQVSKGLVQDDPSFQSGSDVPVPLTQYRLRGVKRLSFDSKKSPDPIWEPGFNVFDKWEFTYALLYKISFFMSEAPAVAPGAIVIVALPV